ncbi:neurotrophin 1-like [Anopheles albimanus]|nr:neurotrophin 1-like [Anopheles albimanus]XP_035788721.1 neurotrophin 1-like [Anopheles albimanus]XP_035788722.1 neurotrophin 1-like [Anopheles albimanus]XP_035788723.1 neurotrophin 1-like [Anopheles albimanus]
MQSRVKLSLALALWIGAIVTSATDSGLPDFELDDGKDAEADDYYYVNDGSDQQMQPSHKMMSYAKPPGPMGAGDATEPFLMEDDDTSFELMDDVEFVEHEGAQLDFQRKAERMRHIMLKAFANREFQRKFGEVLPLLKVMSKTQKSTLAALITAQVNSREGHTLSLEQVKAMFGNRPELILPLVYDIANLIRTVAKRESLLSEQEQKHQDDELTDEPFLENEGVLSNHLLRRSFDIRPVPQGFRAMKESTPRRSAVSNRNDDRLVVDEEEVRLATVHTGESEGRSVRSSDVPFFEKLVQALPRFNVQRTVVQERSDDRMSYHERKLNMTAFNASASQRDQLAMASDGPIPVTLPKVAPKHTPNAIQPAAQEETPRMTLEEIEDLAFGGLNGTEPDTVPGVASEAGGNGTVAGGPVAEKLIGNRQRPHDLHALLPSERCEHFSGGVCIRVANYPTSEIMYSITRHRHAIGALLAEYIDKATAQDRTIYEPDEIEQGINTKLRKREDDASKGGGNMCPSIIRYARPQKARSATGEWKYIVNTGEHTQTLRLEKCSTPQDSCTYLTDNFRSRCVQIYNYHRLLSWDAARGLHVDIFKVPTCCNCHIDGYRETFPPLTSYNDFKSKAHDDPNESASTLIRHTHAHHLGPAQTLNHYSTLQFDQVDQEDDESDDNIAYQFSNGFQRVQPAKLPSKVAPAYDHLAGVAPPPPPPPAPPGLSPAKTRFERPAKHGGGKRYNPQQAPPTLDTYLSPPPNDLAYSNIPFKRGPHAYVPDNALKRAGSVGANRRPLRKTVNVHDQSIAETDSRINQVSVLPPGPIPGTKQHHYEQQQHQQQQQLGPQLQAQNIIEKHRRRSQTTPQTPMVTLQQQYSSQGGGYRSSLPPVASTVPVAIETTLVTAPQPPASTISTSTSTVTTTNGHQRINYNYHPIIDFFEEASNVELPAVTVDDVTQEQIDRIGLNGHTSLNSWKPILHSRRTG